MELPVSPLKRFGSEVGPKRQTALLTRLTITKREGSRQPATAVDLLSLLNIVHSGNLGTVQINLEVDFALALHWLVVTGIQAGLDAALRSDREGGGLADKGSGGNGVSGLHG